MSKFDKLIFKILSGNSDRNIAFQELIQILSHYNFKVRIKGSHHIFYKENVEEILNLQPLNDGKAKAYQVKQVREIIIKYNLYKENE